MTTNAPRPADPPFLISWNVTRGCNLKCGHCYLDCRESNVDDISIAEAFSFVNEIAALNPNAMLILTGGEPLVRDDIFDIAERASIRGLTVTLGTNGTLIDRGVARRLADSGVKGVGISLDSATPAFHDKFRGSTGAWEKAVNAMEIFAGESIDFQLQFSITRENKDDLSAVIELGAQKGARAVNVFFMVCTGRGQSMTDLTPDEYESTLTFIAKAADRWRDRLIVRARCAPHFLRIAAQSDPDDALLKGATSGCIAGTSYLRISPEGLVTPCPYMPTGPESPSLKKKTLREIWETDKAFLSLRSPALKGRCAGCDWERLCGGCRARALAHSNDVMAEDPWCSYDAVRKQKPLERNKDLTPSWTAGAKKRLESAPVILRPMIKMGMERYARLKGIDEITPEMMLKMRQRAQTTFGK